MTKKANLRRQLWLSTLAVLLCIAMLAGSTAAWFTDTASTQVSTIQAGTLDLVLEYQDGETWKDADKQTLNFIRNGQYDAEAKILWEPGCTYALPTLRIRNNGNLALKYQIHITGVEGDAELLEVIDWTINGTPLADFGKDGSLLPEATSPELTLAGHMLESADNDYQGKTLDGIAITVYATQQPHEYDSNGNTYDEGATFPSDEKPVEKTLKELMGEEAQNLSGTILVKDAEPTVVAGINYASVGSYEFSQSKVEKLILDGGKLKVSNTTNPGDKEYVVFDVPATAEVVLRNMTIEGNYELRTNSWVGYNMTYSTLTVENCTINGTWLEQCNHWKSVTFRNCTFTQEGVNPTQYPNNNEAWLIGWNNMARLESATFENCTFTGSHGIQINSGNQEIDLTVKNCTITLAAPADIDSMTAIKLAGNVSARLTDVVINDNGSNAFDLDGHTGTLEMEMSYDQFKNCGEYDVAGTVIVRDAKIKPGDFESSDGGQTIWIDIGENVKDSQMKKLVFQGGTIETGKTYYDSTGQQANIYFELPDGADLELRDATITGACLMSVRLREGELGEMLFDGCTIRGTVCLYCGSLDNITFRKCALTQEGMELDKYGNSTPYLVDVRSGNKVVTMNLVDCSFTGSYGVYLNGVDPSFPINVKITGCEFTQVPKGSTMLNIRYPAEKTIMNNTFNVYDKNSYYVETDQPKPVGDGNTVNLLPAP